MTISYRTALAAVLVTVAGLFFFVTHSFAQQTYGPSSSLYGFDQIPTIEVVDLNGYWVFEVAFHEGDTYAYFSAEPSSSSPPSVGVGVTWDKSGQAWWLLQKTHSDHPNTNSWKLLRQVTPPNFSPLPPNPKPFFVPPN